MGSNHSARHALIAGSVGAFLLFVLIAAATLSGSGAVANEIACENYDPAWSADGQAMAFVRSCDEEADIYLISLDGTNLVRLTETPGQEGGPAWSPDGSRLAYTYTPEEGGRREIWTMAADGTDADSVTDDEFSESHPTWSPDGKRIAFERFRNDNADIWILDLVSEEEFRVTTNPARDVAPSWSPDGRTIAFQSNRDGRYAIYGATPEESAVQPILELPGDAVIPDWSYDGSSIAFAYQAEGENDTDIWMAEADGGNPVPVMTNDRMDFFPKWSPRGSEIAFMTRNGSWDIFVVKVDGTGERRVLPALEQ